MHLKKWGWMIIPHRVQGSGTLGLILVKSNVYDAQQNCNLCLQMQTADGVFKSPEVVCTFILSRGTAEKNPYFLLPAWTTCDWDCHWLSVRVAAIVWIHTELQVSGKVGRGGNRGGQRTGMPWSQKREKRLLVKGGDTPQSLREFCEWWKCFGFVFDFFVVVYFEKGCHRTAPAGLKLSM